MDEMESDSRIRIVMISRPGMERYIVIDSLVQFGGIKDFERKRERDNSSPLVLYVSTNDCI